MSARIEEIRIQNFRAFENARLTLSDLTFLVGRNGAGKSSILDAIEFLREALADNLPNALDRRNGFLGVYRKGAPEGAPLALSAILTADVNGQLVRMLYGFRLRDGGRDIEEVLRVEPKSTLGYRRHNDVFESGVGVAPGILPDRLVLPAIASFQLWNIAWTALTQMGTYEVIPQLLAAPARIQNATRLARTGANAADVLDDVRSRPRDLEVVLGLLRCVTPNVVDVQSRAIVGQRLIYFIQRVGESNETFSADQMSLGTLRALGIALALRQSPAPSLLLLDEIEDSVHPRAIEAILEAAYECVDRYPVVLTTHSPEVLGTRQVTPDRVRIVQWEEGVSRLYALSEGTRESIDPITSAGDLLRINALWPSDSPEVFEGDILELRP